MLFEDATPSYRSVPVVEDSSEPRKVYNVRVPRPVLGEEWHVCTEVHVTNDDLRERGAGVAAVTEVRFSDNSGNGREDGFAWLRANGSWNVGVEAHHALISRSKWLAWTPELIAQLPGGPDDPLFVKLILMVKSEQAQAGDKLDIKPDGGFLQVRQSKREASFSLLRSRNRRGRRISARMVMSLVTTGLRRLSMAGTLVGLHPPKHARMSGLSHTPVLLRSGFEGQSIATSRHSRATSLTPSARA
jgi:hypothetical protein